MTILAAVIRWAHLLSLMGLFGASAFGWVLNRRRLTDLPQTRIWLLAALITIASAALQLVTTTAGLTGGWTTALDPGALSAVLSHTTFGQAFVVRFIALVILVLLAGQPKPWLLGLAILSAVALACIALTGHAAANGQAAFAWMRAATDATHLWTGGFWVGGLAVLLWLAVSGDRTKLYAEVGAFSEIAIYAVTLLMLVGMINAGFIFAAQRVGWTYFLLLACKVVLALAMLLIAFINRLRIMPALEEGQNAGVLARNIRLELILGGAVVGLAAILGSISPS